MIFQLMDDNLSCGYCIWTIFYLWLCFFFIDCESLKQSCMALSKNEVWEASGQLGLNAEAAEGLQKQQRHMHKKDLSKHQLHGAWRWPDSSGHRQSHGSLRFKQYGHWSQHTRDDSGTSVWDGGPQGHTLFKWPSRDLNAGWFCDRPILTGS